MWMFCKSCQDVDWLLFNFMVISGFVVVAGLYQSIKMLFGKRDDE